MLIGGSVPKFLKSEALQIIVLIIKFIPIKSNLMTTPPKLFLRQKCDLENLKVFGCLIFIHLDKTKHAKFNVQSIPSIYLGLDLESKI